MDTKLNWSTTFHPKTNKKIEVVNRALAQIVRGYNQNHSEAWDENMVYIQCFAHIEIHTSTGSPHLKIVFDIFDLHF